MIKELDINEFNDFCNTIRNKIHFTVANMIFEQEAWQTARIFENDLWKGFKKIPSYDQFEIRLSTFGLSNNDGKISGAVYVRKIGFDIVQKIEFWSHSSYTVVK